MKGFLIAGLVLAVVLVGGWFFLMGDHDSMHGIGHGQSKNDTQAVQALQEVEYVVGEITVSAPWSRATAPGAPGVGYMRITNGADMADRLVSVTMDGTLSMLHSNQLLDGVMKMRHLSNGREIPAGATVEFKPSGDHVMFSELQSALTEGATIGAVLKFERAGSLDVEFRVMRADFGTQGTDHSSH